MLSRTQDKLDELHTKKKKMKNGQKKVKIQIMGVNCKLSIVDLDLEVMIEDLVESIDQSWK